MRTVFAAAVLWIIVVSGVAAQAQTVEPSEEAPIIVTGERTEERARAFVDQVALTTMASALARWDDRICVGAVGLAADPAQALVDRISSRAQRVGLRAGEPGCRANVMVIYSPDSDTLSRQIVDQRRDLLGFFGDAGEVTAGREAMEAFAGTPRPVRWWHVSSTGVGSLRLDPDRGRQGSGRTAALSAAGDSGVASGGGSTDDVEGTDAVRSNGSRARQEVRNDLSYVLVIVDARRVANVPATAWMDYVAMVTLAQIDAEVRSTGYSTILNVFDSPNSELVEMTEWDLAFLDGLYRARSADARRQAADIARRMGDSLSR